MIAGLPWTAWLLVLAAVGLGPVLVIPFYVQQRRSNARGRRASGRRE